MKIVVTTLQGLENVLAKELADLNLQNIKISKRAVECEGSWAQLYKCNYQVRTAIRVLVPIQEFQVSNEDQLYDAVYSIDWYPYIKEENTLAIRAAANSPVFKNSRYVTYKAKDAIVDHLRDKYGYRPSIDTKNPDTQVHIFISDEKLIVSLDSSGQSLHLRNYKERFYKAPLNEVIAAGIILLSDWNQQDTFYDPMCGSGTLVSEALMMASNLPPGYFIKEFGFQKWADYHPEIFKAIKQSADERIQQPECAFKGSDYNKFAVRDLKKNLQRLPFREKVQVFQRDFFKTSAHEAHHVIINPPYDKRVEQKGLDDFYKMTGDHLKNHWQGSQAWIFTTRKDAMKSFGLHSSKKYTLDNGGDEAKLYKFEIYAGSKKRG